MSVRVHELTLAELKARREALLRCVDYETLKECHRTRSLVGEEWERWHDICDLDWLIGIQEEEE